MVLKRTRHYSDKSVNIQLVKMSYEARVLYDFDSVSSGELGVREWDMVTVMDSGIGQGWVMARAGDGREGVVPEAYLEPWAGDGEAARRASATPSANSWGEDWDSDEEEHRSVRFRTEQ